MNPINTANFAMAQFCAQQIQNVFNLQTFPFSHVGTYSHVPVPQGRCPLAVGWYKAVLNAQITELRLGNMCDMDHGTSVANYFGMTFTFLERSYHFWVVDSGVHSALAPHPFVWKCGFSKINPSFYKHTKNHLVVVQLSRSCTFEEFYVEFSKISVVEFSKINFSFPFCG